MFNNANQAEWILSLKNKGKSEYQKEIENFVPIVLKTNRV